MHTLIKFAQQKPHGLIALAGLLLRAALLDRYGFFIDEYYYIACSERLAAAYVDHPPLSIWLLAGVRGLLGDSIYAIRLPMASAGATLIYLCGALAGRLGGGWFARALAASAALTAPFYLGLTNFYSMNGLDLVFWAAGFYVLLDCLERRRNRDWVCLGIILGLGLLNKLSVLFLGAGLAGGLLLAPNRRVLLSRGPWLAASIALLLFTPYLIGQARMDWATLEFMQNASLYKNNPLGLVQFTKAQVLSMHPVLLPLWSAGLYFFLVHDKARVYRVPGWVFVLNFAVYVAMNGKAYYLAPAYCVLLAGGARLLESALEQLPRGVRFLRAAVPALVLMAGAVTAPLAAPILPIEKYMAYNETLGLVSPKMEKSRVGRVPQTFADMFGYAEVVDVVANVIQSLPSREEKPTAILASSYGLAGSLEFLGRTRGLPPVYSGHNNYFYWWRARKGDFQSVIAVGIPREQLRKLFGQVEERARSRCAPYCMPARNNLPVYFCKRPRVSAQELRRRMRRFI